MPPSPYPVRWLRGAVWGVSALASLGVLAMMSIVCADVLMRRFGRPWVGAFDLVRICGAVTIACALPLTTAVKGHVAVEYFFHKLSRPWRIIVDSLSRLICAALFGLLCWRNIEYGRRLLRDGQVTMTLGIPLFWVPWVIALGCGLTTLVILYHLLQPGRELIRP